MQKLMFTLSRKLKIRIIYKAFPKIFSLKSEENLVIGMGSENYELIDTLEGIAKSLESLAESQKRIADTLEWMVKDKGFVD
ncbi:MAG TPA: hypothetical protein HA262_14700 [Methanosarcina sp.]|nr:hypothetical protein [Methanosarcina sp.]